MVHRQAMSSVPNGVGVQVTAFTGVYLNSGGTRGTDTLGILVSLLITLYDRHPEFLM